MLTKEQLFALLEHDRIQVSPDTINKAKNDDGEAVQYIGQTYKIKNQDYSKAMAWYRLAADQNNSPAYNCIGYMYFFGLGVPQDYLTAMEYYLKAARGNETFSMSNIGLCILNGDGILVDKYKALEWYIKSGEKPEEVKKLNEAGFHLWEEDKKKTIYQLANETEDIIREERMEKESKLKEEIAELKAKESKPKEEDEELKKAKYSNEQGMENLRREYQTLQIESQEKQQQILVLQHEKELLKQVNSSYDKQLKEKDVTIKYLRQTADTLQSLLQPKRHESTEHCF